MSTDPERWDLGVFDGSLCSDNGLQMTNGEGTMDKGPCMDGYMVALNPHELKLADVQYWRAFGLIRHFLRSRGYDPNTMYISLYPDVRRDTGDPGGWTWWGYDHRFESEPAGNETNYIHEDGRFEFYGVTEHEPMGEGRWADNTNHETEDLHR